MEAIGDQAAQVLKFWMNFTEKLTTATASIDPLAPPADTARQMRSALFAAMSESGDQFMRSPQFLEFMKRSSDLTTDFRARFNEFMTASRHDAQAVAREDIDSLMVNVQHIGGRILDGMEELQGRLDKICARLDALESNGNGKSKTPVHADAPAPAPAEPSPAAHARAVENPPAGAEPGDNETAPGKSPQPPRKGRTGGRNR